MQYMWRIVQYCHKNGFETFLSNSFCYVTNQEKGTEQYFPAIMLAWFSLAHKHKHKNKKKHMCKQVKTG